MKALQRTLGGEYIAAVPVGRMVPGARVRTVEVRPSVGELIYRVEVLEGPCRGDRTWVFEVDLVTQAEWEGAHHAA